MNQFKKDGKVTAQFAQNAKKRRESKMKKDGIINSSILGSGRKDPLNGDLFLKELREVFEKNGVNSIVGGSIKVEDGIILLNHVELDISDKKRMREHPPVSIK